MFRLRKKVIILVVFNALLIGCSDSDQPQMTEDVLVTANDLDDIAPDQSRWVLNSYQSNRNEPIPAVSEAPFNFSFVFNDEGDRTGFFGFDGCNVFLSENILMDGNTVMPVNGVSVDTLACGNLTFDAYISQFDFFYTVISDSFIYEEVNSQLVLRSMSGQTLTFDPCILIESDNIASMCEPFRIE